MTLATRSPFVDGVEAEDLDALVLSRCARARQLEESGNYEEAAGHLGEFWRGIGVRPRTERLSESATAEVLLRAGALTSWLGSLKQIGGSQESAKNLISESATLFESLDKPSKASEARINLAICYWREGGLDEARLLLEGVLSQVSGKDAEQEARAVLALAIVERRATRYGEALRILTDSAPLFDQLDSDAHKGRFHNQLAIVLEILGGSEGRADYIDRALIEHSAASFHFERAGHVGFYAGVETNLGLLFNSIGRHAEAFEHLDRAKRLYESVGDLARIATVEDNLARVLLAEHRYTEAVAAAQSAVSRLESGDEHSLLIESLTTYGKALARLQKFGMAQSALLRAVKVGEQAGDLEGAGQAALTLLEELGERLGIGEMRDLYLRSDALLSHSQDAKVQSRLRACARRLLGIGGMALTSDAGANFTPGAFEAAPSRHEDAEYPAVNWNNFSLKDEIHRIERRYIELALRDAGGMVSHAARLLGFNHHESLASLLKTRHSELLPARTPAKPRRRSIITGPRS